MIQPEPEGSTQGYPLVSVEVLRKIHTKAGNPVKEILLKFNLPDHMSILTVSQAGYPGITRMLELVEGTYYWPRMGDDVKTFMRTCLIFQQDKIEQKKSGGLLEPLPTPEGPCESVSIDFITCLPNSKGGGSIIVVVDRFLKYETFIAAPPNITADDTAKPFFKNVAKYWGVPHKYGFKSCDPVDTPMVEKSKLDKDKEGKAVDLSHYFGMIGTLLYLPASRPDLQFAIRMCAR
nr:hypothetical protein CTI12_AA187700 [Tanacetum cinerariifolium]